MSISVENFGEYLVKNVKSFIGREGHGFNANLYRGKKKIAFTYDDASGGEIRVDWVEGGYSGGEEGQLLKEYISTLPELENEWEPNRPIPVDEQIFVSDCVAKWQLDRDIRKMRKQCQTKTFFRISNQEKGKYSFYKSPCTERLRQIIRERHGEDVEIFNDVLEAGDIPSVF